MRKANGNIRLCGNCKTTVNKLSYLDRHPLPRVGDMFAALAGGTVFSKLDMSEAYAQVELNEDSRKYTTNNTHRGLFQYRRIPYGIKSAPSIFQRSIESILAGIPNVLVFLDDILITGKTTADHKQNLYEVLNRLQKAGLKLREKKCQFYMTSIVYLGHKISGRGIETLQEKIQAILEMPRPSNTPEVQAYLGHVNFYRKCLPNLSETLEPNHHLLRKGVPFQWGKTQEIAFSEVKSLIQSAGVLTHYDPNREMVVTCDASPKGVGAVLHHIMPDGTERPVVMASRSLCPAEKNNSQIDREALAQYVYGKHSVVYTDHKPLLGLFGETKSLPERASPRILRWAIMLQAYNYTLKHKSRQENGHADGLSRLPLPKAPNDTPIPGDIIHLMETIDNGPVTSQQIKEGTSGDPVLAKVRHYILTGWPSGVSPEIMPFFSRKDELSVEGGCMLWGCRVVVPPKKRVQIMAELHDTHSGITLMKAVARSLVWWPGLDTNLEKMVKSCESCQESRNAPPKTVLHPWEYPNPRGQGCMWIMLGHFLVGCI